MISQLIGLINRDKLIDFMVILTTWAIACLYLIAANVLAISVSQLSAAENAVTIVLDCLLYN